jgi:hypothetical protein
MLLRTPVRRPQGGRRRRLRDGSARGHGGRDRQVVSELSLPGFTLCRRLLAGRGNIERCGCRSIHVDLLLPFCLEPLIRSPHLRRRTVVMARGSTAAERLLNRRNWRGALRIAGTGSIVVAVALTFTPSLPGQHALVRNLQLREKWARPGRPDARRPTIRRQRSWVRIDRRRVGSTRAWPHEAARRPAWRRPGRHGRPGGARVGGGLARDAGERGAAAAAGR